MLVTRRTLLTSLTTGAVVIAGASLLRLPKAASVPAFGPAGTFPAEVNIDPSHTLQAANARLCGSNVQWVDGGDGLLPSGTRFDPDILARIKTLSPSVLRYPGGSNSDVYQWRSGVGPEAMRGTSEHFHRKEAQTVRFGTAEFLALCENVNAKALITVNVATGSAKDAGDWVRQTNVTGLVSPLTGKPLKKVGYWEIGNEPYLKEDVRPETWMAPEEYAKRANAAIRAMRLADPDISIGIPLRSDSFNGLPVTPYPGYNNKVLAAVSEKYDFIALHNAYLPYVYDRNPNDDEAYAALMGASASVLADLDATRAQLAHVVPGKTPAIALTEYNALLTLGRRHDAYLASPAGALYVADLLRLLTTQSDILMANHWSLIGNWFFGALSSQGAIRPVYHVLRMYRDLLQGNHVGLNIATRNFAAPGIGLIRPNPALPSVTGTATRSANTLRIILINKDPAAAAQVNLRLSGSSRFISGTVRSATASSRFADADDSKAFQLNEISNAPNAAVYAFSMAPTSISLFEFTLANA